MESAYKPSEEDDDDVSEEMCGENEQGQNSGNEMLKCVAGVIEADGSEQEEGSELLVIMMQFNMQLLAMSIII